MLKRFALLISAFVAIGTVTAPATAATAKPFPVTVKSGGFTTTVKSQPKRIVSLSPAGTEILFGVGAGKQVVAVDSLSNYPAAAPKTEYRKTGTDKVGSWACDTYEGSRNNQKVAELCTVAPAALGFAAADFEVAERMADFFSKLVPQGADNLFRPGKAETQGFSGVPVRRVLFLTYVVSGLLAGVGGVVLASQLKSGSPTFGQMYELYVIAAVVVGGASLNGGTGRMFGTLIGAFIIAVIQNGMNLMNVESYTQKVVLGLVILGAVLLDLLRHRGWKLQLTATE